MSIDKYAVLKCDFCEKVKSCQRRLGLEKVAGYIGVNNFDCCEEFKPIEGAYHEVIADC